MTSTVGTVDIYTLPTNCNTAAVLVISTVGTVDIYILPDSNTAAVLLIFPSDNHPVRGVAVHTVLHRRIQLIANKSS